MFNMDKEAITQLIQQQIQNYLSSKQFGVAQTPFHTHSMTDGTPNIPFVNITKRILIIPYTLAGTEAATAGNYSIFFTVPFICTLSGITEVHVTKGTDGSAVTLQLEHLIGTTASGSGTALLATAFDLKGTINTVQTGTFVTKVGALQFSKGDRIGLVLSGTPTAVANVTVTLTFTF